MNLEGLLTGKTASFKQRNVDIGRDQARRCLGMGLFPA